MISTLWQAFRLNHTPRLALVGAGGKSISLFRLAHEHAAPVLLGCTAHLSLAQANLVDRHITARTSADIPCAIDMIAGKVTLFTGPDNGKGRWSGLSLEALLTLKHLADELQAPLLFESDGSRCLPLKAWEVYEPPIPEIVDTVVVCVGMSGLEQPLNEEHVFRSEIFSRLSGLSLNEPINVAALSAVLMHPEGGLKNIPTGARRICLLNQADTPALQAKAQALALRLQEKYEVVVIAALGLAGQKYEEKETLQPPIEFTGIHAVFERAAGIVLAAGGASRMGQPKLLLPWRGEPLIRHTVRTALAAGLSPVVVVTGADADAIQNALSGLPVQYVHNPNWQVGQSTSVKCGLAALPPDVGAAAFLLGDQPQIPIQLVSALLEQHRRTLAPITCPLIGQQRGNPVLFDRVTFPEFFNLQGDAGARQIFSKYSLDYLPWHDQSLLLDVDTPEDYARLKES